mmetsp:Transcript_37797/g.59830  ORF Transcript_37797/g.59830 Transcript_37797/m.59830 type:complete len:207 (+) Transcript_37797:53-673(+)
MGCACASSKGVDVGLPSGNHAGTLARAVADAQASPTRHDRNREPQTTMQYLVQCNHCGARLELVVPPETPTGIRIETSCAGCHRLLQVRLGVPGLNRAQRGNNLLGRGGYADGFDNIMAEKAMQEAVEQNKRAHVINDLPCEMYNCTRHKDLSECEFCLEEYAAGDELMRLPCMHCFHSQCVAPWLRKACTCPVCQINVIDALGSN